jgi:outer membrane protein OmpA-like peptidoglycan-associated protein
MSNALAVLLIASVIPAGAGNDQPPIITLSETEGFTFPVGSAAISPQFVHSLEQVIGPRLLQLAMEYDCDVIEVIGHTDGQSVRSASNLDTELMSAVAGELGVEGLAPGSNADLGLMRAWAVARVLTSQKGLSEFRIAAYSAGQMLRPDGSHAVSGDHQDVPERRRIEIRIRRSSS